ncbi:MAG: dCTP deaminase [Hyphomicrobiales bacterium]|jgi:dCTP deaminase|nr:dCTP deaminase [Hyphomicrobiales bacterium]
MLLGAEKLSNEIGRGNGGDASGIAIVPSPDLTELKRSGEASVSVRLGRWFLTMRVSSETDVSTIYETNNKVSRLSKQYFVPFGEVFVLHPNRFVLASTLEWIRLPPTYAALVVGKSSLARRGIIIETAAGVHPGFSGCLTLEIANVGEIPVKLVAGMMIGQLFVQSVEGGVSASKSSLAGQRKPRLGQIREDEILTKLLKSRR